MKPQLVRDIAQKFNGPSACAVLTETSDGDGDVRHAWTMATVEMDLIGGRAIVHCPATAYKDKHFEVSADQILR